MAGAFDVAALMSALAAELAARDAAHEVSLAARDAALEARMAELSTRPSALPRTHFSAASSGLASRAVAGLGVRAAGGLRVDVSAFLPPEGAVAPFDWTGTRGERAASPALLTRLAAWVREGAAPPIANHFFDVQGLAAADPLVLEVDGVAIFSGMVDAVAAAPEMVRREELAPISSSALACFDWKTPAAFANRGTVCAIAHVQALAFHSLCGARTMPPVFMTDLASGFRAWIVLGDALFYLHSGDHVDLTLREGVALVRLFLSRAREGATPRAVDGALAFAAASPRVGVAVASGAAARGGGERDGAAPPLSFDGSAPCAAGGRAACAASNLSPPARADGDVENDSPETCAGGDDGEDNSLETAMQQIAVALSRGGGFRIPF